LIVAVADDPEALHGLRDLGGRIQGFTVAGFKSDDKRLIVRFNDPNDLEAVREAFTGDYGPWWQAGKGDGSLFRPLRL